MQKFTYKKWKIMSAASREHAEGLFDFIDQREYKVAEWLKKHPRSEVIKFRYNGKDLILKIPKEKNSRPWIRFTTLYRRGEAFKNISSMELLRSIGIKTTKPVMAAEKRSFGIVTDSWIVYEYLEGENCVDPSKFPQVVAFLNSIHKKGYLHGDAQIRNFLYAKGQIFAIDANPRKPLMPAYAYADEFAYLVRSAPGTEKYFQNKKSYLYQVAKKIELESRLLAGKKRRLKNLFLMLFKKRNF